MLQTLLIIIFSLKQQENNGKSHRESEDHMKNKTKRCRQVNNSLIQTLVQEKRDESSCAYLITLIMSPSESRSVA